MDSLPYYLQTVVNGILAGCIYALFAMGLTLIYGVLNFVNFAHGELIMWGAYFLFLAMAEPIALPLYAAVPVALGMTALLGAAMDFAVFRPLRQGQPPDPPHRRHRPVLFSPQRGPALLRGRGADLRIRDSGRDTGGWAFP